MPQCLTTSHGGVETGMVSLPNLAAVVLACLTSCARPPAGSPPDAGDSPQVLRVEASSDVQATAGANLEVALGRGPDARVQEVRFPSREVKCGGDDLINGLKKEEKLLHRVEF